MHRTAIFLALSVSFAAAIPARAAAAEPTTTDPIAALVARLDLDKYKATIKGLTKFGDRRQGTDRNRAAVDWIEAQLKSYGCGGVARLKYEYQPTQPSGPRPPRDTTRAAG